MPKPPRKIAVIGGGITGLSAAYRLHQHAQDPQQPIEVHLFEASSRLGGTVYSNSRDGFLLEEGPDCFLSEKTRAIELCKELGLEKQIIGTREEHRRSFIVKGKKLYPVPEGFYLLAPSKLRPFLSSPLLSWRGKWRVLRESLQPARPKTDESLASFVRRRLGQEALDWLAQPLLAGIYAADPETLSLQATFPGFLEMEEKHGSVLVGMRQRNAATKKASGARYALFSTLQHGMQTLTDRLGAALPPQNVHMNTTVTGIKRHAQGGWDLHLVKGQTLTMDAVCLALPAYSSGALLYTEDPGFGELLKTIPYAGSATLNFAFKASAVEHPMEGFGFVSPILEKHTALACTFVHRKFAGRVPRGHVLLRAFAGGALQPEVLKWDDKELAKRVLADLKMILGITEAPLFATLQRWPRTMPQYTVGHTQRILHIEEMLLGFPGLALAGNWLRGVGIPDCIESGERAAEALLESSELAH